MAAPPTPLSPWDSAPTPSCQPPPEAGPVGQLIAEMRERWLRGERPLAEEFLARQPELWGRPEAAIALIYEELALRQECGAEEPEEALLARFPQWRKRLQLLLECDRLLAPGGDPADYPDPGESLGGFRLVAELGRGVRGRVFLATQPALADRPVVLKLTPREGGEYLALARLQHTNIVPLLWVQEDPERNLRLLCMPYFGGATLASLQHALAGCPPGQRTGGQLVEALDACNGPVPAAVSPAGLTRQFLARASHAQALCWIGACLADALAYAHERGLVHFDLKPANVLLAADGQPMLLDFHLARPPVRPGVPDPGELGGTPLYMPPEQQEAMEALAEGRPVGTAVDERADVFALGAILYEALGGPLDPRDTRPALHCVNPQVSKGLSDIIARCLAPAPRDRYPTAAALGEDLRRHLGDRPLCGVANRCLFERWRKWRRRRPAGLRMAGLLLAFLGTTLALAGFALSHVRHQYVEARYALQEGSRQWRERHHHADAVATLEHGLALTEGLPLSGDLTEQLHQELQAARAAQRAAQGRGLAAELHRLADGLRTLYGEEEPVAAVSGLEARCGEVWGQRHRVRETLGADRDAQVDADLLDVAVLCADFRVRSAPAGQETAARREALRVLAEAEDLFGTSAVLEQERGRHARALGEAPPGPAVSVDLSAPRTAWEHYALGRSYLSAGELAHAAAELDEALRLEPEALWPNYYRGLCAYRLGHYDDAALAFSVCVGAAPGQACCYYQRARAYTALGRLDRALADYDRALALDPACAAALLNRGMLHYRARHCDLALADLRHALEQGADPALAHYDLALVHLARHDRGAALSSLRQALARDPRNEDARRLLNSLTSPSPGAK